MTLHFLVPLFLLCHFFAASSWALSLDEALQSALQKNGMVAIGREQVLQAEEHVTQSKSAIYPSLSLNSTYLLQPEATDPALRTLFPAEQTITNFSLNQPLFRGFREFAAMRQRKQLLSAQKKDRLTAMVKLYEEVATSFLDVLTLEQDLKNLNEQRGIYARRVKDLQARTRRGESSSTEGLTAQSTAAALDAEIQLNQARLKTARENFAFLTALPVNTALTDHEPADKKAAGSLLPLNQYLERIEERPDVQSAKARSQASEEDVSIARGGHWPSADATANYYLQRPGSYPSQQNWDLQLRLTLPIFEGGLRQSQVREALSLRRESEIRLQELRRQLTAEIRSRYESFKMRDDQLRALKLSSDLAEKNYQVLLRESRRGLSRSIDVQLALTEYRSSRRTYDQVRYSSRLDRIRLETAAAIFPQSLMKEL